MKITTVSYGKTFNLGDFNSERIDMSAELTEGDTALAVLEELKVVVCGSSGVDTASVPSVSDSPYYPLFNFAGQLIQNYATAFDWLQSYDLGANLTKDVKSYVTKNFDTFMRVKHAAESNDNPRPLKLVKEIEQRVGGMCQ